MAKLVVEMENPCDKCPTRITYALMFDVHMSGEDCSYYCEKWERYKAERKDDGNI